MAEAVDWWQKDLDTYVAKVKTSSQPIFPVGSWESIVRVIVRWVMETFSSAAREQLWVVAVPKPKWVAPLQAKVAPMLGSLAVRVVVVARDDLEDGVVLFLVEKSLKVRDDPL